MVVQKFRCLSFPAQIRVPESIEEYDKLAGKVGVCLAQAIGNIVYRSVLAGVRADFCEALERETGIKRAFEIVTGADGKPKTREVEVKSTGPDGKEVVTKSTEEVINYTESEAKYVNRVQSELKLADEAFIAKYQHLMDAAVNDPSNKFDPTQTEPKERGPKKLPEAYVVAATRVFNNGNQQKWADRIKSESGAEIKFLDEGDLNTEEGKAARAKNIETLGWAIKANEAWKMEQARNEYQ